MASDNSRRTVRELARVIFSRLLGIILILVVVVAAVVAATYTAPWQYRSGAMLLVKPAAVTIAPLESPANMRDRLSLFVLTQRELIVSQHVVASALMRLDGIKPKQKAGPGETPQYTPDEVSRFIASNVKRISRARKRIKVRTPGGVDATFTQTINVFVDWPEEKRLGGDSRVLATERAQKFTRYLLDAYMFRRDSIEAEQRKKSAEFLMSRATGQAKKNLKDAQKDLKKFVDDEIKGDILLVQSMIEGIGETGFHSLRTRFQGELNTVDARLAELGALIGQIDKETEKGPGEQVVVPERLLKANDSLVKIIDSIVGLRLRLNNLRPQFDEKNYKPLKELKVELAANLADLKSELKRQRTMLVQETAALQSRRGVLANVVANDQARIAELAGKVTEYTQLNKAVENAEKIFNKASEQHLNAQAPTVPIQVLEVDPPSRPDVTEPHRPLLWAGLPIANTLVGIFAGLVLALVYAFLADHFDHTVKGIDDVERYVQTGVLASVPRFTRRIIRSR